MCENGTCKDIQSGTCMVIYTSVWSHSCSVHAKLPFICIHVGLQTSPVHAPIPDTTPLMLLHDCPQLMCIPLPLTVCVRVYSLMLQRVQWEVVSNIFILLCAHLMIYSLYWVMVRGMLFSVYTHLNSCIIQQVCKYSVLISIKLHTFSLLSSASVRIWVEGRDRAEGQLTTRSQVH